MSAQRIGGLREHNGILIPDSVPEKLEPKCPAAQITRFADTGRPAIKCGVEGNAFAVEESPVAALGWCCGDYTDCPVWMAERENDDVIDRVLAAKEQGEQDRITRRQIERGIRFDDRGHGPVEIADGSG